MTIIDRIGAAAENANVAITAPGLLAPFNDAGVLSPLDVHAATVIARLWGEGDDEVVLAAALARRGTEYGHVCIRLASQREVVAVEGRDSEVVDALPWPDPDSWGAAVASSRLVGDGTGDEPLVLVEDRLYLERYYRYEETIAGLIDARISGVPSESSGGAPAALDPFLEPISDGEPNRQHEAVVIALSGRLTMIAGGPGTGKTYTMAALLAALARRPDRGFPLAALCAPTGKAAARLGEALDEYAAVVDDSAVDRAFSTLEPSTIHRLLGWSWDRGRFRHHRRNRLPHDLVMVDEMSMVSLPLAAKLMEAVRDDAAVVLVGDPFQLASIEAGTVLADIVGPSATEGDAAALPDVPIAPRVVMLDRVRRFDEEGAIARFASAVRLGDADLALEILDGGSADLGWLKDPSAPRFARLWEQVVGHRTRLVELAARPGQAEAALTMLGRLAVLCAHRDGSGSVAAWRRDIGTALDERFPGLRYGGEWYPGRPVMVTGNDYRLELFNGDIGVAVQTDDGLRVAFDRGGMRFFRPSDLGEHTTVHAMTIHKSQGSQFEDVVVSLPAETSRLLTRDLLYTAVTRASRTVTIVGDEASIRHGVERSVQRASGLRSRLWG